MDERRYPRGTDPPLARRSTSSSPPSDSPISDARLLAALRARGVAAVADAIRRTRSRGGRRPPRLQYYWGEHIHLGYYDDDEMAAGYKKKDFIQAK